MLRNYLKSALRNLWRYKGHSLINILGLAVGMACLILIMLYVKSELSYDSFHEHKQQIYLLNIKTTNPQTGEQVKRAIGPYRLADELVVDFPDFEQIIRFAARGGESIDVGDQTFVEENLAFVDPEVFQAFTFPLIEGSSDHVLEDPYSVVITPEIATKYFGRNPAIGKMLRIRDHDFAVTGILKKIPDQSQFQYDILISMNSADCVADQGVHPAGNSGISSSITFRLANHAWLVAGFCLSSEYGRGRFFIIRANSTYNSLVDGCLSNG